MARNSREEILEGTLHIFNERGLKFTMDDLAKSLGISKKTIYANFKDKNALFLAMVDYCFDAIARKKEAVLNDASISPIEKIKIILGVMPDNYINVDFKQLYMLRDKFPEIYKRVEYRLESGWEPIIELLEQGIKAGTVRNVSLPIVKMMLEASIAQFFSRDILIKNNIDYNKGLTQVVEIITEGIMA